MYCAPHPGRGVFDDFAWLFQPDKRVGLSSVYIWAAEAAFQSIFRLTVEEFTFVAKHTKGMLQRRRDRRGRKPIPVHIIMSAALLYLANGLTYKMTAIGIRNGLSEVLACLQIEYSNIDFPKCLFTGKRITFRATLHARR